MSGHKREWKVATRGAGALVGEMAPLQACQGFADTFEWRACCRPSCSPMSSRFSCDLGAQYSHTMMHQVLACARKTVAKQQPSTVDANAARVEH